MCEQRDALVAIYNSANGDDWSDNTNWLNPDCDVCEWFGVKCDDEGRVAQLELVDNNLVGSLDVAITNLK